jgi:hypothetical protein
VSYYEMIFSITISQNLCGMVIQTNTLFALPASTIAVAVIQKFQKSPASNLDSHLIVVPTS